MKEIYDEYYIKKEKEVKNKKILEQVKELENIFYEIKPIRYRIFKKCPYKVEWTDINMSISIRDKRYKSIESTRNRKGAIVVNFKPFDLVELLDKNILSIIKEFGGKWGYKKLIKKWA